MVSNITVYFKVKIHRSAPVSVLWYPGTRWHTVGDRDPRWHWHCSSEPHLGTTRTSNSVFKKLEIPEERLSKLHCQPRRQFLPLGPCTQISRQISENIEIKHLEAVVYVCLWVNTPECWENQYVFLCLSLVFLLGTKNYLELRKKEHK